MVRSIALILVGLVLALGGAACAPKLIGPTAGSGYVFSLEVSESVIWLGHVDQTLLRQFPPVAELIVQVKDAQGRPVDGVPVTFEVESGWVGGISLAPSQSSTRGGIARATISDPRTTGVVHVMARVDNTTAQARLLVQSYKRKSEDA
jgi:hypothetical protein